jgi:hypothetical protein
MYFGAVMDVCGLRRGLRVEVERRNHVYRLIVVCISASYVTEICLERYD